jgi:class II lanthipeptide synthase
VHLLTSSHWYNALTLSERVALRRSSLEDTPDMSPVAGQTTQRLGAWRAQEPFNKGDYFNRRLASHGMSEEEFSRAVSEPIENVHRMASQPPWLETLDRAFSQATPGSDLTSPEDGRVGLGLLEVVKPLLTDARVRLQQGVRALATMQRPLPFDPDTITDLLTPSLAFKALRILDRTLVLELNVARLNGVLDGETAEERFQSFVRRLSQRDKALALLEEYPVLARQLVQAVDQWIAFNLEFLEHLSCDWKLICATFNANNDLGTLVELHGSAGDSHRKGRSVRIARFSFGFSVVYKPRSLALDAHFQELLAWLNERGCHALFRTLQVLDCGGHGWVEFVEPKGCSDVDEVRRFYQRQGGYLALLYALAATDFHAENLIAEGEHPVLLDLEALFHPRLGPVATAGATRLLAHSALESSVLQVGLLPHRMWATDESDGLDVSGLGAVPDQLTPHPVPQWQESGTDTMRLVRQRVPFGVTGHRPTLQSVAVDLLDYAEDLRVGFKSIYRLLQGHRDELLSENGPLARFANDELRTVLRATQTYAVLLRESYHPDMLRDSLDRERLFDRLWIQIEDFPYLARVIPAELEDLHHGDIPIFTSRPNSCDIGTSSSELIPGFFDESSLTCVRRRLAQLGDEDLERQLWFVNASLATVSRDVRYAHVIPPAEPNENIGREQLLVAARAVGDRLERLALRGDGVATWIALVQPNERHWTLAPVGVDLYDGLAGMGLFLSHLADMTGEERYDALAREAVRGMWQGVEQLRSSARSIGAFAGWGGVIYTLTHLSSLWRDTDLLGEAQDAVDLLPTLIERDETLDVISGSAGCIGSLLSLYTQAPSERTLAVARQCGERLISRATVMQEGIGWLTPQAKKRSLSGFSHGAAGMAWALLELSAVTGEARFRAAALEAIAYERSLFSSAHQNWLDLRPLNDEAAQTTNMDPERCGTAWCHGAPGIGLARFSTLRLLDDRMVRAEIEIALKTTLENGMGLNDSLCHGDLGNLEFLVQAGELAGAPARAKANHIAAAIAERVANKRWLCGNPLKVESPGLMTGLAGIGYGLLRLADPARIPSVLVLAPPTTSL